MNSPAVGLLQVEHGLQIGWQFDEDILAVLSPAATVDFATDASGRVYSETLSRGDRRGMEESCGDDQEGGDGDGFGPSEGSHGVAHQ